MRLWGVEAVRGQAHTATDCTWMCSIDSCLYYLFSSWWHGLRKKEIMWCRSVTVDRFLMTIPPGSCLSPLFGAAGHQQLSLMLLLPWMRLLCHAWLPVMDWNSLQLWFKMKHPSLQLLLLSILSQQHVGNFSRSRHLLRNSQIVSIIRVNTFVITMDSKRDR